MGTTLGFVARIMDIRLRFLHYRRTLLAVGIGYDLALTLLSALWLRDLPKGLNLLSSISNSSRLRFVLPISHVSNHLGKDFRQFPQNLCSFKRVCGGSGLMAKLNPAFLTAILHATKILLAFLAMSRPLFSDDSE